MNVTTSDGEDWLLFSLLGLDLPSPRRQLVPGVELWTWDYILRNELRIVSRLTMSAGAPVYTGYPPVPDGQILAVKITATKGFRLDPQAGFVDDTWTDAASAIAFARPRADTATGLLMLDLLSRGTWHAPALRHQVLDADHSYYGAVNGELTKQTGAGTTTFATPPQQLTQAELPTDAPLSAIWTLASGRGRSSLERALRLSLARFPYAFHSQDVSMQVVLASSILETLLGSDNARSRKRRVSTLLGPEAQELYETTLGARNSYVHEGRPVSSIAVANVAHLLVGSCLSKIAALRSNGDKTIAAFWRRIERIADLFETCSAYGLSLPQNLPTYSSKLLSWRDPALESFPAVAPGDWIRTGSFYKDRAETLVFKNRRKYCRIQLSAKQTIELNKIKATHPTASELAAALTSMLGIPIEVRRELGTSSRICISAETAESIHRR